MMDGYNIIPIGDHCAIAMILKDLGKRTCSYPFDWVMQKEQLYDTNIMYNINIMNELDTDNIKSVVRDYIGDAFDTVEKCNTKTNIIFPHDCIHESITEVFAKYERRFTRLYNDIHHKKNIFVLLTRHYCIEEYDFKKILDIVLKYNSKNIVLFISGTNHPYLDSEKYKGSVIFKHIYYDVSRFCLYDYEEFRPALVNYLKELFFNDNKHVIVV